MAEMNRLCARIACALALAGLLCLGWSSPAAVDEHSNHQGGGFGPGGEFGPGMGSEMSGGTGREMMGGEHGARNTQFYPSLMKLPAATPEQRAQIGQAAQAWRKARA